MEHVLYEAYRRNPQLREQLERQARVDRAREFDRLVVAPVVRWIKRLVTTIPAAPGAVSRPASFQA
jgi:hypothetical protein